MRKFIILLVMVSIAVFGTSAYGADNRVVFLDFSWESAQLHNRISGFILEHGYGRDVKYSFAEEIPGMMGLEHGDLDVAMETWADNMPEVWKETLERGKVVSLGRNFPDAPQGWYVPTYVIKGDPERGIEPVAPDLKSVQDLRKYWELFVDPEDNSRARLYNGPSGWVVSVKNEEKINTYGLDDVINNFYSGSGSALAAAISGSYEKGMPVLAYYWEPTPLIGLYDMTKLEEPAYDPDVWAENSGCAFPACRVFVVANKSFVDKNPEIGKFLEKYETTLEQTNSALAYLEKESKSVEAGAVWFLKENTETWHKWIVDPEVREKITRALGEAAI
jgi:glycine betaine/proline transport system substrate-binding protein